ncbi:PrsW family intramembrane metalloprotease [Patescibacteria group bacterium]
MNFIFYIILGFIPGFFWLLFYLKKDKNPEPKLMILKIFIWGILIAPLIVIIEIFLVWILMPSSNPISILFGQYKTGILRTILIATFIPAITEEYFKYAVVKIKIIKHSVFDEPTDAMIYCIVSGLGFATIENLLALFNFPNASFREILGIISFRFLGATLLHALASATVGYWLAMSLLHLKERKKLIIKGLVLAMIFHGCYNYLISLISTKIPLAQQYPIIILIAILLIGISFYVSDGFEKLKKQQSICKI